MPSPCQSRSTRLFGQRLSRSSRAMAAGTASGCSQPSAWARHRGPCDCAADQHVCRPAPDDRKLFDRPIVVEEATLSLLIKRTSWTSQLL
jgi:hypothetical protein